MLAPIPPVAAFFSSNVAHFHLSGIVSKQNVHYWTENNPKIVHKRPLHSPKLRVECAISQFGMIGPYFFEEEGMTVTVNSRHYISMLQNFLQPRIEEIVEEEGMGDLWFQQDGATAHST
ncbi:hypothetical protein J437_LFUL012786 [Ladona fulva]|uniref:Transposase n=1 Tax=Ladona fulva TaxID=123851 RepID=A0A8K0KFS6_LADFU|nr:hypothetical protein J437_LFUL012786 [Ladona fulva]